LKGECESQPTQLVSISSFPEVDNDFLFFFDFFIFIIIFTFRKFRCKEVSTNKCVTTFGIKNALFGFR